jgi:phage shock protein E
MKYTQKFQALADYARAQVGEVLPSDVDNLMQSGVIALDIRDNEEHDTNHIKGSIHLSRGKLEMLIESKVPDLDTSIMCYCNANNRGALSAYTLQKMGYRSVNFIVGGLKAYQEI